MCRKTNRGPVYFTAHQAPLEKGYTLKGKKIFPPRADQRIERLVDTYYSFIQAYENRALAQMECHELYPGWVIVQRGSSEREHWAPYHLSLSLPAIVVV